MPLFQLNLLMCFLMGCSAGGMLPVVYTLLAEIMPPRHRSWVLVLVGGTGLVGGYLAASGAAHAFEPVFGWRVLWLQARRIRFSRSPLSRNRRASSPSRGGARAPERQRSSHRPEAERRHATRGRDAAPGRPLAWARPH